MDSKKGIYSKVKWNVYLLLDPFEGGTKWDRLVNTIVVTLIILNVLAVMLETVAPVYEKHEYLFKGFEIFSISFFSIEYILRLWTCTYKKEYAHPVTGRLKYIFTLGALIDLISILPFYLPFTRGYDLRFVRVWRLFRFFKLSRYLNAIKVIGEVVEDKKPELIISLCITISLIIMASCLMYFIEHSVQPDKFASIPETMWWSVATLTTVGYGDVYPVTIMGKVLTSCLSILGIGLFALPAGILASGFSDVMKRNKHLQNTCPHCGKELHSDRG